MNVSSSVTLADISQRYYSMAREVKPTAMPEPGSITVDQAPDNGRGTLVDTYV